MEKMIELTYETMMPSPFADPVDVPGMEFDSTHCARGPFCVCEPAAPVGPYLHYNPDTDRESNRWGDCYYLETAPTLFFCEDCAIAIESLASFDDDEETVLTGDDGEVHWFIDLMGEGEIDPFGAWVGTFDRTHALAWELELGTYGTLAEAISAVDKWMADFYELCDRLGVYVVDEALTLPEPD